MARPGLGGEDPAVLHDDLRIQRPPTARALLHHETLDTPETRGLLLEALILSQMASVMPMIQVENMKDAKYFGLRPLFKRSRYGMPIIKCHANKIKKLNTKS